MSQKKSKNVKKIIFDNFITANSHKTLEVLKSLRQKQENSMTNFGKMEPKIEDMSKVNCCYIWYWIIKLWIENRNQVLTFQTPSLMAQILKLKNKILSDWSLEDFMSVVRMYIHRIEELKNYTVKGVDKRSKRSERSN